MKRSAMELVIIGSGVVVPSSRRGSPCTAVRIGSELNMDDVDLSVVSTTYEAGEHGSGRVGVLGPMRMDYRRAISAVEEVRENLEESLGSS